MKGDFSNEDIYITRTVSCAAVTDTGKEREHPILYPLGRVGSNTSRILYVILLCS